MKNPQEVKILLVEDDIVDQQGLLRALKTLKLANEVVVTENGQEALDTMRLRDESGLRQPFLVLLDINMPKMNGLEFLEEVRADEFLRDTVVFVLTTSKNPDDIALAYKNNVAGYIVKTDLENSFLEALSFLDHYWRIVELKQG